MSQIAPYFWLLPTFLYAETHYRFPYFFSFLRKPEPEVIADLPHRLEPGHTLPVLVLVKDAHLFPASLRQIRISLRQDDIEIRTLEALKEPLSFSEKLAWHLISVDTAGIHGWLEIDVEFELECRGTLRRYHNDNHRTSSHSPLRVYVSNDPLPCYAGLFLGDPHTHSDLTEDQVEFGIPIRPAIALASAMGLSYFCVTDHSYDLDDSEESYLRNDPSLPKWNHLQHAVDEANRSSAGFVVIRGEEVSCTNSIGETVHLLLYGLKKFFHGSGDGAERVGHTQCEHSVVDVLSHREDDVPSFAAHALEPVPFLQRLILHRGSWHLDDLLEEGLTGLQIINGKLDEGFHEGYRTWISLLLRGKRAIALAGDDAHGNFNRFRQIGIPFLKIKEHAEQIFGKMRTAVISKDASLSEQSVVVALGLGRVLLTDGPIVRMDATGIGETSVPIGGTVRGTDIVLCLEALSTSEFGEINSLRVLVGARGREEEATAYRSDGSQGYVQKKTLTLSAARMSYVRVEVWTSEAGSCDKQRHFCITNPIWIERG